MYYIDRLVSTIMMTTVVGWNNDVTLKLVPVCREKDESSDESDMEVEEGTSVKHDLMSKGEVC